MFCWTLNSVFIYTKELASPTNEVSENSLVAVRVRLKEAIGFYHTWTLESQSFSWFLLEDKALTRKSVQFELIVVSFEG